MVKGIRTRARTISVSILFAAAVFGQSTTMPMFTPALGNSFPAGPNPHVVVAGDFNGDQIGDIAVVNPYAKEVTILIGTLTGAPVDPPVLPALATGNLPSAAAAGYFVTGSSNLSLAVTNLDDDNVWIYLGNGDGTFMSPMRVTALNGAGANLLDSPTAIVAADLDLDGNVDLAVANAGSNSVTVLFGDGKGGFPNSQVVNVGARPVSLATGNFGGVPGLAVANQMSDSVTIISAVPNGFVGTMGAGVTMTARGTFPVLPGLISPPYVYPSAVAVADFNQDGIPDIVTANDGTSNLSVLLGDDLGGFTPAAGSLIAVGLNPMALATADFNGDGNTDLAVANYSSGTVTVLLGAGNGTFTMAAGSPYPSGESPASVAAGDFNGSGRSSLAVANQSDNTVTILLNGTLPPVTVLSAASLNAPVSPGSVISIFGMGLASASMTPPFSALPYTLGGASVIITYSNGMQDILQLSSVSPTQINAIIPANPSTGSAPLPGFVNPTLGLATVAVVTPTKIVTGPVEVAQYAPALFSASQNGKGVAAATFMNALSQTTNTYQCSSATVCVPLPLDLSAGGVLTLTGTGFNNISSMVRVTVGSQSTQVTPAVTSTPGVYQLSVQLSANPVSRGVVPVMVSAPTASGSVTSNVVTVLIQ
jgi:uncharacterized protein (TIGR03437 family)